MTASSGTLTDPVVVEGVAKVTEFPPSVIAPADEPGLHKGLEVLLAKVLHSGIILWSREICKHT